MHGVEAKEVGGLVHETGKVLGIQLHPVDAADAASGPEKVRLAVVIHINLGVKTTVPAVLHGTGILEGSQVLERPQRTVGDKQIVVVAGKIELAVVFHNIRCDGNALHPVKVPVQQVF